MRLALRLAKRGFGETSPNPLVGAVLVKDGQIIGHGWHHRAGQPHAEIEAIRDAQAKGARVADATLYVTLEPCSTQGRTPPCTQAILAAGLRRVVAGATDPNPCHAGRGFGLLEKEGLRVRHGLLVEECLRLNEAFNHWIVQRTPFVTVKAAMTLDGKIATAGGESKWITSVPARAWGMRFRLGADAVLVFINTVLADDPSLTLRLPASARHKTKPQRLRRIILDAGARTPLHAKVVTDERKALTTIVVSQSAPARRVAALAKEVNLLPAPPFEPHRSAVAHGKTGRQSVTSLLVEGGGEVNASFLTQGLAASSSLRAEDFGSAPRAWPWLGRLEKLEDIITLREVAGETRRI